MTNDRVFVKHLLCEGSCASEACCREACHLQSDSPSMTWGRKWPTLSGIYTTQSPKQQGWEAPEASATEMGFWKVNLKGRVRESILIICTNEFKPKKQMLQELQVRERNSQVPLCGKSNFGYEGADIHYIWRQFWDSTSLGISPRDVSVDNTDVHRCASQVSWRATTASNVSFLKQFKTEARHEPAVSVPHKSCTPCYRDARTPCVCCAIPYSWETETTKGSINTWLENESLVKI